MALNAHGQIAFQSPLTDASLGIWGTDTGGHLREVVRTGDLLQLAPGDARTVAALSFLGGSGNADGRPSGFSDNGDVTFWASFTDGSSGVFVSNVLATPEPGTLVLAGLATATILGARTSAGGESSTTAFTARRFRIRSCTAKGCYTLVHEAIGRSAALSCHRVGPGSFARASVGQLQPPRTLEHPQGTNRRRRTARADRAPRDTRGNGRRTGALVSLGSVVLKKSRKEIHCFAGPAPADVAPRPASWEVDRAEFVPLAQAQLLHPDQAPLMDRLLPATGGPP